MNQIAEQIEGLLVDTYGFHREKAKAEVLKKFGIIVCHYSKSPWASHIGIHGNNNSIEIFDNNNFTDMSVFL